jgi:predicted RNase H-like nuclease (RuvC/YqgF family)
VNAHNPLYERFNDLLERIHHEVDQLKKENHQLIAENENLKKKLERANDTEKLFSTLGEPEKIALKQQINGLIRKIDQHLEA